MFNLIQSLSSNMPLNDTNVLMLLCLSHSLFTSATYVTGSGKSRRLA